MFLYIDPGTGSMLFSILIGVISTLVFVGRKIFLKLKFVLSGGKSEKINNTKIPYLIFSDHKRYWNVFKPICDEFEERKINLVYWTSSPDDPALVEKYEYIKTEFIGEGNKAFARLNILNAGIVLSTTPGLDVLQWKRSKTVDRYVHILHAVDDPASYRMFGLDFYDSVLLSGSYQIEQIRYLENKRNLKEKELAIVGCPYMDIMNNRLKKVSRKSEDKITVLLAPSWGASGILAKYGEKILDALIATGFRIIVRPHPQTLISEKNLIEPLIKKYVETDIFTWNYDNDNFDVLNSADILITDFSGIIFDYSLIFDRPLIYADTSFDTSPYDAAWLEQPMWKFKVLPKLGVKLEESQFSDMKTFIENTINNEELKSGRDIARKTAWENIGKSAEFTADYMIKTYEETKCKA
ncbi:CDP-glycerol glycerophosphotransferase family protein [Treponema sp.]|uniref:CDP-glycerol glycerophosphotransferase family protein n=1 Tax=Treponema sp. TaxID=166 RepID=UPI003F0478A6